MPEESGSAALPIAIIGVFSHDGHSDFRDAIRSTWLLQGDQYGLSSRFVLRGNGSTVLDEAREHGDMVLLDDLPALMPRTLGPLALLLPWMKYALRSWPYVELIGKADDDVWLRMPALATHLRAVRGGLIGSHGITEFYWGVMESSYWSIKKTAARGWGWNEYAERRICKEQQPANPVGWLGPSNGTGLIGPFPFAKGPLFLTTRRLTKAAVDMTWLWDYVDHIVNRNGYMKQGTPYEDILYAAALACLHLGHLHLGPAGAAIVHLNAMGRYCESDRARHVRERPSNYTLIYHEKAKNPEQLLATHELFHDDAGEADAELVANRVKYDAKMSYRSCGNSTWAFCTTGLQKRTQFHLLSWRRTRHAPAR